ncbi:Mu-like prophage major head subunit gpT [Gimesia panareensis]|uniref:Mu-like prophage major head subunit gpT n=1 Tax=Gimesia panareensis TaxID=2527978 RepID=A0A517Q594_9PLAN|nr:Mu-like prophage major head subunit gpT family protein [Gimesia panareensis]QDT26803.1 Mu-like prophage major head subunit gpT [Gimesia panareensis]
MAIQPRGGTGQLSERGILGMFYEALETPRDQSWIGMISEMVDSDQEIETYRSLGHVPRMKIFQGSKDVKQLRKYEFEIRNEEYDVTVGIPVRDIRRDKTGQIQKRLNEMVTASTTHWNTLASGLIVNGHTAACYDDSNFFATDHQVGDSGVQTNIITASDYTNLAIVAATNPTAAEFADAILSAIQQLYSFKDEHNEPLNEEALSFIVMVPIQFWAVAQRAVSSNFLAVPGGGQTDNPLKDSQFKIEIVPNSRITFTDSFCVFRADSSAKALIRQEEVSPEPDVLGAGSDHAFKEKEWLFSVDTTRAMGYGAWHQTVKVTFSTAS